MADENNDQWQPGKPVEVHPEPQWVSWGANPNQSTYLCDGLELVPTWSPSRRLCQLLPSSGQGAADEGQNVLRVWHRLHIRGSYIHPTIHTPQTHPASGEYSSPPLG